MPVRRRPTLIYEYAVNTTGIVVLVLLLIFHPPSAWLLIFGLLVGAADFLGIRTPFGHVSFGFAFALPAEILFGPATAALALAVGNLVGNVLPRGRPPRIFIFNVAQFSLSVAGAWLAQTAVAALLPDGPLDTVVPYFVFVAVYFGVNNTLVTYMTALETNQPIRAMVVYIHWEAFAHLVTAVLGTIFTALYTAIGVVPAALAVLPALALSYLLNVQHKLNLRNNELEALYEATHALSGSLDWDDVCQVMIRSITRLTHADRTELWVPSPDGRWLQLAAASGAEQGGVVAGKQVAVMEEGLGQAFRSGQAGDASAGASPHGPHRFLVPLVYGDTSRGILCIERPEAFREDDRHLVSILAPQAAIALRNAAKFQESEAQARTDPMTGLPNFRHFADNLPRILEHAAQAGLPVALIYLDLNNFRDFNNRFGHQVGDTVLQSFGDILTSAVRQGDLVARYGGDEFVAVLPGSSYADAHSAAQRIEERVHRLRVVAGPNGAAPQLSVSSGIAVYPHEASDADSLVYAADQAMYRHKHGVGGSSVREVSAAQDSDNGRGTG